MEDSQISCNSALNSKIKKYKLKQIKIENVTREHEGKDKVREREC